MPQFPPFQTSWIYVTFGILFTGELIDCFPEWRHDATDDVWYFLLYDYQIVVEDAEDVKSGFTIVFKFNQNPYFEDRELQKTVLYSEEGTVTVDGTPPKWLEGMVCSKPALQLDHIPPKVYISWHKVFLLNREQGQQLSCCLWTQNQARDHHCDGWESRLKSALRGPHISQMQ